MGVISKRRTPPAHVVLGPGVRRHRAHGEVRASSRPLRKNVAALALATPFLLGVLASTTMAFEPLVPRVSEPMLQPEVRPAPGAPPTPPEPDIYDDTAETADG